MNIDQVKNIQLHFIVTTARTGSTLLSSMLNASPNILSTIEEPFSYNLYTKYSKIKTWSAKIIEEYCYDFFLFNEGKLETQFGSKKDLATILEKHKHSLNINLVIKLSYLCFFPSKTKESITTIIDKQLIFHNYLEKIHKFYPQSKFIILCRDPRDQVISRYNMLEKRNRKQTLYKIACTYNYVYKKIFQSKKQIGDSFFLEIKYEDLILNPEKELKKICSFLNTPYNNKMIEYELQVIKQQQQLSQSANETMNIFHSGISQKINTAKIGLYKQSLKSDELNLIWTICKEVAEKIGYKEDENHVSQGFLMKHLYQNIGIVVNNIKVNLWYAFPFSIKRIIKKIKYRKSFKSGAFDNKDYYKKSYN